MATYNIKQIITPDGDVCRLDTPGSKIWYGTIASATLPDPSGNVDATVTTSTGDFSLTNGNILILDTNNISLGPSGTINVDGTGAKTLIEPSGGFQYRDAICEYVSSANSFTVREYLNYHTTPGRGLSYQSINYSAKTQTLANESPAWYCNCATASGTAAKVLTSTNGNFSNPTNGDIITVRFAEGDVGPTQTTTLNIDSSGAYELNRGNLMGPIWGNGGHQTFVFRGSKWYTVDTHQALNGVLGVVMLSNAADSSLGTNDGYAATPKAVADAQTASRTMNDGASITWNLDAGETVSLRRMGSSGSYGFGIAYSDGTNTKLQSLIADDGSRKWIAPADIDYQTMTQIDNNAFTTSIARHGTFTAKAGYVYNITASVYLTPASDTTGALVGVGDSSGTSTSAIDGATTRQAWASTTASNGIRLQVSLQYANTGTANKTLYVTGQTYGANASASVTRVSYMGFPIVNQ